MKLKTLFLLTILMSLFGSMQSTPVSAQSMNISVSNVECVRFGKGMRVTYLLTNNSDNVRYLACIGASATLGDGSRVDGCWYKMGVTQNTGTEYDAPGIVLLPGVPEKCDAFFKNVPDGENTISNTKIFSFVKESTNDGIDFGKRLGDLTISLGSAKLKSLPQSNKVGVCFTNPDFTISYGGCTRAANGTIKLTFSLTNTTRQNIELYACQDIGDPFSDPATAYDSNGSKYVCSYFGDRTMSLLINGKSYSYMSDKIITEPGVPKKFTLTLNGVPMSVKSLSRIGIWMRNKEYSRNDGNRLTPTEIVFKNISIN